jgi:hypothetical protein
MTDCRRLSDRIPAVALGRDRWTAEDEVHLAHCDDCRSEWELVRAAGRIGEHLPPLADRADLAAAVLRRVTEDPVPAPRRRTLRWAGGLAAAAAVTLAVWTGGTLGREGEAAGTAGAAAVEPLSTAQVDSLLEADEVPLAGWSMLETPTLGDLNEDELERLLRTWEG